MTRSPASVQSGKAIVAAPGSAAMYLMYGLHVMSNIALPALLASSVDVSGADLLISCARSGAIGPEPEGPEVARLHCEHGHVIAVRYRGEGGECIRVPWVGTFHIREGGQRVDVYPVHDVDERVVALVLCGLVPIFVLQRYGRACLHAGAIVTKKGAVAFLGPKGQGKSTMVGVFLRRGAELLTDDALLLESIGGEICGVPSLPFMKVWDETADQVLHLTHGLPHLAEHHPKRLFSLEDKFGYAPFAVPLRAFYVLARHDIAGDHAISVDKIGGRDALSVLLKQTAARELVLPTEMARFLPLYARLVSQAPVFVVRYPSGLEYHQGVYEQILATLENL